MNERMKSIFVVGLILFMVSVGWSAVIVEENMDSDPYYDGWACRDGLFCNYTISDGMMYWPDNASSWGGLDYDVPGQDGGVGGNLLVNLVWRADEVDGVGVYINLKRSDDSESASINFMAHTNSATDSNQFVTIQTGGELDPVISGFSSGFITGTFLVDADNDRILYWLTDGTHSASGMVEIGWSPGIFATETNITIAAKSGCQGQVDYLKVEDVNPPVMGDIDYDGIVGMDDLDAFSADWLGDRFVEVSPPYVGKLLGQWALTDANSVVIPDSSGEGNDATRSGAGTAIVDSSDGMYFDKNVTTNYISLPAGVFDELDPDNTTAMTITFWAKGDVGDDMDHIMFWGTGPSGTTPLKGYFPYGANVMPQWFGPDGGEWPVFSGGATYVNDGIWHHWALTKDSDLGKMQVYMDGVLRNERAALMRIGLMDALKVGGNGSTSTAFQGWVKDVRIYDYFLLEEAVVDVMAGNDLIPTTYVGNLLGQWALTDADSVVIPDSSGEGNDGTRTGAGTAIIDPSDGMYFDKNVTTSFVSLPAGVFDELDPDNTTAMTITFWAKGDIGDNTDHFMFWGTGPSGTILKGYFPTGTSVMPQWFGPDGGEWPVFAGGATYVNDGLWHHWAFTKDSELGKIQVVMDGVVRNERTATMRIGLMDALKVGGNGSTSVGFQGWVKDVRIYDYFLLEDAIVDVMAGNDPTTIIYDPIYECSGSGYAFEDMNLDCSTTLADFALLASNWMVTE